MRKTALITGATSGFGAAAARRFAQAGWRVVATGRRAERIDTLVDEFGSDVAAAVFDVRDAPAMDAALSALPEPFRGIDMLVNNAGPARGIAPAQQAKLDDWLTMIDTNVTGLVTITHKAAANVDRTQGHHHQPELGAASYPYIGGNVYAASKAFVQAHHQHRRSTLVSSFAAAQLPDDGPSYRLKLIPSADGSGPCVKQLVTASPSDLQLSDLW